MFDIIIKSGMVIDGTGKAPFPADVAIDKGNIVAIEPLADGGQGLPSTEAKTIIDAKDRFVMPGFIDVHGHSDINILANPNGESKIRQGITTEIISNCGDGVFPLRGEALDDVVTCNSDLNVPITWKTANEYFELIDQTKPAFNIAALVGHGTLRLASVGNDDRTPTAAELAQMVYDIDEAMEAGVLGMSTGLIYPPGLFADDHELLTLQSAVVKHGGIYASHVRGEGSSLLKAADEFERIVRKTNSQGQFSHIKASGPSNWGKVAKVITKIEEMNKDGLPVYFDKYPYIASSTSLQSLLPRWVMDGGRTKSEERLRDPSLVQKIVAESVEGNEGRDGWYSVLICQAHCEEFEKYQGKSIGEVADMLDMDAGDLFVTLLLKSGLRTSICNFTMCQEETDLALTHRLGMPGSDSGVRAPYGILSMDTPHPRAYGTFGKYFRDYVKSRRLLTFENAVHHCTDLPCQVFGLKNRGRIEKGYFADVLVMDFESYEDKATYADPHQYCTGLDAVFVNGVLTVSHGKQTGERGGRSIRKDRI
ncbi:MAG: D-aminoacylase [Candidatus Sumerlaeales bacterium]|nr:D-aminoacylase [Candidatus Sumerlaeales bacterium]